MRKSCLMPFLVAALAIVPIRPGHAETLKISGTGSSAPLVSLLFEAFRKQVPDAELEQPMPPLGSGGALKALAGGRVDLAFAGRPLKRVAVRMNPFETGYAGMDAKGPFDSISGTLMSIPFCIALTLLRGTPSMAAMTTYTDAEVNALTDRIDLISDESIAILSCVIEAELADGTQIVQDQRMTVVDFWGITGLPVNATWVYGADGDAVFALLRDRLAHL